MAATVQTNVLPQERDDAKRAKVTEADHQKSFDKAAQLLCRSPELSMGGGVVLFEATITTDEKEAPWQKDNIAYTEDFRETMPSLRRSRSESTDISKPQISTARSKPEDGIKERVMLAAASIQGSQGALTVYGRADSSFAIKVVAPDLRLLCEKFPRGKLFQIPSELDVTQYDRVGAAAGKILSGAIHYSVMLKRQFPDARQLIFIPMYHANFSRWTACFAYTTSPYRVFTYDADYLHTLAFCNSIRAEIVRLATNYSDQQKGEFIGSVSHELRSPLHGILASIEFLADTECTTFQRSCLDTAESCARTLMDTGMQSSDVQKLSY
jgi:hypothetical protein